jgi:hypothetical protein
MNDLIEIRNQEMMCRERALSEPERRELWLVALMQINVALGKTDHGFLCKTNGGAATISAKAKTFDVFPHVSDHHERKRTRLSRLFPAQKHWVINSVLGLDESRVHYACLAASGLAPRSKRRCRLSDY